MNIFEVVKPEQTLPKQIKVIKMPTPPQAPTGPDGTDENGTQTDSTYTFTTPEFVLEPYPDYEVS